MIRKIVMTVAAALLLSGCVLQAKPPFFTERDGLAVLGGEMTAFDGYELKDGAWSKTNVNDPPLEFTPAGRGYTITERGKSQSKSGRVTALLVPLKDGWLAMQLTEGSKLPIYSLAKLDGHDLLVAPIMCSDLKTIEAAKTVVEFNGNDCTAKTVTDARAFLQALAKSLPPPRMKLVPIP
jgi:hypothetical protein